MSEHSRRNDDTVIGKLLKIWPLMIALVMVAIAWGTVQTKLLYLEKDLEKISNDKIKTELTVAEHSEALKILPEMREDIKKILREFRLERNR